MKVIALDYKKNFLLIIILFLITPQYHIFHKYYDPIVFIIFISLINLEIKKRYFFTKKISFT